MEPSSEREKTTRLLLDARALGPGHRTATEGLFAAVYGALCARARYLMSRERADHTLSPTALVHETYLRLIDDRKVDWKSRTHFFGVAARAMRQVLVEHARRRAAAKRGGGLTRVTFTEENRSASLSTLDVLALDEALQRLAEVNPRVARVVELKVFAGLEMKELARILEVSKRTAENDWTFARMWLARELDVSPQADDPP